MNNLEGKTITISKEELAALPAASFNGNIHLIDSPDDVDNAINCLRAENIIGFDTETKPNFKRGQSNNVSLIQLSTYNDCFLFRLNHIGVPDALKNLLEDKTIKKIGLSIHDDFHNLNKFCDIAPVEFIDLQDYVKEFKFSVLSLSKIYAILFNERISKGQRLSNWEAETLSIHQQGYAALDAYACLKIYDYLSKNNFKPEISPYLRDIEIPQSVENNETKD